MAKKEIRPIRVEGNIAFVPLTQGYEAVIDALDVPRVSGCNWAALVARRSDGRLRSVYAIRSLPRVNGKQSIQWMHRVIAGTADGFETDHKDSNGLNNARANLRTATRQENSLNNRKRSDNKSGVKGVRWHKKDKKWVAQIRHCGTCLHLGNFTCRTAAAVAYAVASAKLHKEFGRIA